MLLWHSRLVFLNMKKIVNCVRCLSVSLFVSFVSCSSSDDSVVEVTSNYITACASGVQQTSKDSYPLKCWTESLASTKDKSGNVTSYCKKTISDKCCEETFDKGVTVAGSPNVHAYEDETVSFLNYWAKSNGQCTGGESGAYQCAAFVQQFYSDRFKHNFRACWGTAEKALSNIDGTGTDCLDKQVSDDFQSGKDPVFVFKSDQTDWRGLSEEPRIGDALVFSGGGAGHIVIATKTDLQPNGDLWIDIIEQNVANLSSYGPIGSGASCYHRVLVGTKDGSGSWNVGSGIGYQYTGFIRHNLAGIYPDIGWHVDGMSQKFRDAYLKIANDSVLKKSLGWAFSDSQGSPFVHRVRNIELQNFKNTNPENRFGTDGETALVVSPNINAAGPKSVHLLKEGFWGAYKCIPGSDGKAMGGAEYLGAPQSEEIQGQIDGNCQVIPNAGDDIPKVTYQLFENGCMWWWKDEVDSKVHVHLYSGTLIDADKATACGLKVENNPPSADCSNDCKPGTQQCLGSSQIQICGHPGSDSCYHWLTLNCASGTSCVNNSCVSSTSSTVSIASASTGGAASFGGSASTGGSTLVGVKNCTQSARRCPSNSNQYQICILDTYSGAMDWMSFDCASGQTCQANTGICGISTVTSVSTGGSTSIGGASSVIISSGGGSSLGGSSSQGGSQTTVNVNVAGGGQAVSIASASSGGAVSTSSSNSSSTGGAGLTTSILSSDLLHMHYAGPITGKYILKGWWNALSSITSTWDDAFSSRGCVDANITDNLFDCDILIPSGVQDVLFQINLPDGRYWGDMSYDPTGGKGAMIGTLTLSKGSMTLNYEMKANPEGSLYSMGHLPVVP